MTAATTPERTLIIDGMPVPDTLDEEMVRKVVHGFYDEIRRDDLLGPIFNGIIASDRWPYHLDKMCDFWSSTLLHTARYEGRPMPPHLAIPELGEEHFRRWLRLFRATVSRICPPDVARIFMSRALRIAHSFRLGIAFHRGENSLHVQPITEDAL